MSTIHRVAAAVTVAICLSPGPGPAAHSQEETPIMSHAHGPFDVKVIPQPADDPAAASPVSRLLLDKHYHGELEGPSQGQMLAVGSAASGVGAYVALEQVTATLDGRRGGFALSHRGVMDKNGQHLEITVVPGSGTGEFEGITGTMGIDIAPGGKHSYDFEYTLPAANPAKDPP